MQCSTCHFVYSDDMTACPKCGTPASIAFVDEDLSDFSEGHMTTGYPQQPYAQYPQAIPNMQAPLPQKKSKLPLVLGIVFGSLALIALICVLVFVVIKPFDSANKNHDNVNASNAPTAVSNANAGNVQVSNQSEQTSAGDSTGFDTIEVQDETTKTSGVAITGLGTCKDSDIVVPQSIKQSDGTSLPVLWDAGNGFSGMENTVSITLPEGMQRIDVGFKNSPKLETIVLPSSIREIGPYIFENCPSLKKVTYLGTGEQWDAIRKPKQWDMKSSQFKVEYSNGVGLYGGMLSGLHGDYDAETSGTSSTQSSLSTDEPPVFEEFAWLTPEISDGNIPAGAKQLTQSDEIAGGWKAFLYSLSDRYLLNVDFKTYQDQAIVTFTWRTLYDEASNTYIPDDAPATLFMGTFENGQVNAVGIGQVTIEHFWEKDGHQYATGRVVSDDGTLRAIMLYR